MSRLPTGENPMRVLWLADSMKTAAEDAQMGAFMRAADTSRLYVDLLALSPAVDSRFGAQVETRGGFVCLANALNREDIGAFLRVRRWVRDGKYDLIHTHASWASLWGAVAGRLLGVPVVATLYDREVDQSSKVVSLKDERRAVWALRRWGSRVIALSGAQWDRYVQEGIFSRSFLEVIYQGVETSDEPIPDEETDACKRWLRDSAGFPPGGQIAVTVADLDDWESGVDVLLWAIPTIIGANPQARFVVVGEGEHKREFQRRVRARGLNKIISWQDLDSDVDRILAGSDLFIHPSLRDPFPVSALKAMAEGLPVIGTRVGGVPEIIGTSEAGRLVPRSNADALAEAVVDLLQDPPRLAVMGRAASYRARSLFPVSGWVDRLESTYHEVVGEARESSTTSRPKSYARLDVELLKLNKPVASNGVAHGSVRQQVAEVH